MTQANERPEPEAGGVTRATLIKRGLAGAGALSGAAFLAACGEESKVGDTPSASAGGKRRSVIWAVAAIQPGFLPIEIGFIEACDFLGWRFQKVGVPLSQYSPETVVSSIRQAIQAQPDVIVTPGWVPGAYTAIEEAQKKGILCVLSDANNSPDQAERLNLGHVGSDEQANGVLMGEALIAQARRKGKTSGTFIFGNPFPGNANLEAHATGLREAAGGDYKVVVYKEPLDPAEAITGYKAQITKIGDDLVGIEVGAETPVARALQELGKQPGDIIVGTFYDAVSTLELVKQGWVTTIVAHQMYSWGFLPTMLAYQALERGVEPRAYVNPGQLVDASNVDAYLAVAKQREELGSKYHIKLA